jgi:ligand-binding sensor domain-containing protein
MKCFFVVAAVTGIAVSASLGGEWESYLHSNKVSSIWTDESHVYWGSTGGVVIYDPATGANSKIVKTIDGLRDNRITAVALDSDNGLWIGTGNAGVSVLLGDGSWEFHGTQYLDLPKDEVSDIAVWGDRTVVGTGGGVSLFENGRLSRLFVGDDWGRSDCNSVLAVALSDSEIVVGTECGLFAYSFTGGVWTTLLDGPVPHSLDYDEKSLFWIVTDDSIYTYDGTGLALISKQFIKADVLRDIVASDSIVWVAGSNGPAKYDAANTWWVRNVEGLAQSQRDTRPIFMGDDGTLWLGTRTGIGALASTSWVIYTADGPAGNYVEAIEVDATGTVWCMTGNRWGAGEGSNIGVLRFDGSSWEQLHKGTPPPDDMPSNWAYCVDRSPVDESIWIGFWGNGGDLLRYDIHTGEWTSHVSMLDSRVIADIYIDENGTVVFAEYWYEAGVGILCGGTNVVHYNMTEDPGCISHQQATAVGPGPDGSYLVGDFDQEKVHLIDTGEDCLDKGDDHCMLWTAKDGGFKAGTAYDIEMDPYGVVWLATSGGLSCYDGEWHIVSSTVGAVWDVEIDSSGTKWVGSEQGLYALKGYGVEWDDFSGDLDHYDWSNSPLPDADIKAVAWAADGALWIGTAGGGVYRFSPPADTVPHVPVVATWVDVYPNPYVEDAPKYDPDGRPDGYVDRIEFTGFKPGSRIKIYTLGGDLVADIDAESAWTKDTMEENGTASGIYIYHAYAQDGREFVGRVAIIR